jgi:hypothetical protein
MKWFRPTLVALTLVITVPILAEAQSRPPALPMDALASPGHPGWLVDDRTGCWVWDPFPDPNDTVAWSGGCGPDARAAGHGVVEWRSDGKVDHYEGDVLDGKLTGHGIYTSNDGSRYEGELRENKLHGHGALNYSNGNRYEGEFRDNRYDGTGVFSNANGDYYKGDWRDGRANGYGESWTNGVTYQGNWADGCYRDGKRRASVGRPLSECQ